MTLDERLRASLVPLDSATPDVAAELQAVKTVVARRRRRRVVVAAAAAVAGSLAIAAFVRSGGDSRTEIGSTPASDAARGVLVPSDLPDGLTLVGVQQPSTGSGSGGSGPPFSFTRTYAQFSADRTRVERSFQIGVGVGDQNTEVYRADSGDPAQISGFPGKISGDENHSTLMWFDGAGRIFRVAGDVSRADAVRIAEELDIASDATLEPESVRLGELPPGFEHLFDVTNPRTTTFRGRTVLYYATPSRDATLQIELQRHPSETVDERLLFESSRVVDVRGRRGVLVDRVLGSGRELRWFEPGGTLVIMSATTLTSDQLQAVAEGLRPISDSEWRRLRRDVGPLGPSSNTGTMPQPTVEPLELIAPEVVAAQGTIDDNEWRLMVYEVTPAAGRSERRFCYELRGDQSASQNCFPLRPDAQGWQWLYGQRHLGRWFLLGAAPHGSPSELSPSQGQPVPLQISEHPDLPMQVFVAVLPDPYDGTFSIRDQGGQTVNLAGPATEGARAPFSTPGLPGVYPEFPPPPFLGLDIHPQPPVPPTNTTANLTPIRGAGKAPVQVLNASGTNGLATMRSNDLRRLGWKVLSPDNHHANRVGNAVQCLAKKQRIAKRLMQSLRTLDIPTTTEPIPRPLPIAYDPRAACYVVLG